MTNILHEHYQNINVVGELCEGCISTVDAFLLSSKLAIPLLHLFYYRAHPKRKFAADANYEFVYHTSVSFKKMKFLFHILETSNQSILECPFLLSPDIEIFYDISSDFHGLHWHVLQLL